MFDNSDPAVVIGLCSHGLSIVRSLGRAGIKVFAVESDKKKLGTHTRYAKVIYTDDINSKNIIEKLKDISEKNLNSKVAVLYLTNDNMVKNISESWNELDGKYLIGFKDTSLKISYFLNKNNLEGFCSDHSLMYPESNTVDKYEDLVSYFEKVEFPLIAKPSKPLSRFKVVLFKKSEDATKYLLEFKDSFPIILQKWVPGDDSNIYFCASYLEKGNALWSFIGKKIRSSPPALGQTTSAIPSDNILVHNISIEFFKHTELSGPVSLELKLDQNGQPWIIEPTVGRTDFWLPCCIFNNFDLPIIQYNYLLKKNIGKYPENKIKRIWFDSEKDPLLYLKVLFENKKLYIKFFPVFSYFDLKDPGPFVFGINRFIERSAKFIFKRIRGFIYG